METRLVTCTEGYCPLCCCPVLCPCQGGQLPHDGKAGRKENQMFSVRQWNMTGYMTSTLVEIGKKNMQRVFIQKIHLKLTQRKTQTELCQIWRQLNSMSLSTCSTINYAAKTELFWDLPSRELGQFQGMDSNEFVHCMLMLNIPALEPSSVTLN